MELELGLKITKVVDDINSANLVISKDKGTLFLSRETNTMFILTAHLNGYRRENIKVDINEDGTKLTIHCEKPVQEMIMVGWKLVKRELEMRGTEKSFKIPNGVVLDKIKAKFNDKGSILTISMPKIEKGSISGVGLEEFKEDEVLEGDSQSSKATNEAIEKATTVQENQESEAEVVKENGNEIIEPIEEVLECDPKEEIEKESSVEFGDRKTEQEHKESEKPSFVEESKPTDENPQVEKANTEEKNEMEEENVSEHKEEVKNEMEKENVCEHRDEAKNEMEKENACEHKEEANNNGVEKETVSEHKEEAKNKMEKEDVCEHKDEAKNEMEKQNVSEHKEYDKPETSGVNKDTDQAQENEDGCINDSESIADNIHGENSPRERSKLCVPIVVGSALIVSFFVFVFHFIRSKNQASRRSN